MSEKDNQKITGLTHFIVCQTILAEVLIYNNKMENYQIIDLVIYPVKSLGGISLESCELTELGFQHDRRWMLVDASNRFISQREIPQLALFECHLKPDGVQVVYGDEKVIIPFDTYLNHDLKVSVWEHEVIANEVDEKISTWFSNVLSHNCKLVTTGSNYNRIKTFIKPPFNTKVSFADGYPYLILGTASLELLNSKLSVVLPYNRFRPNIFVKTNEAHEEDAWNNIDLGTAQLKVIKPCARCIITTIDQSTGTKGKEPLKTLSTYRKDANSVLFGANAMMVRKGNVNKNDLVVVK